MYSRTRLMRFIQDRTPTCSMARTLPLAQPAASAIASYEGGKHLPVAAL